MSAGLGLEGIDTAALMGSASLIIWLKVSTSISDIAGQTSGWHLSSLIAISYYLEPIIHPLNIYYTPTMS